MKVYEIDPISDGRWEEFLKEHRQASVFHSAQWLRALQKTYGYTPVVFTTSAPGCMLTDGIAFCNVRDWFGRHRLVSLPFSDHCTPLAQARAQLTCLLRSLRERLHLEHWGTVQIRSAAAADADPRYQRQPGLVLHSLDLCQPLETLFRTLHPSCIQRKIKRASQAGVVTNEGTSDTLLKDFYRLLLITRRRHGIPPQPVDWFQNLIEYFGDQLKIRVAYFEGAGVASILTIRYKQTLTYKYGCSDRTASSVGAMPLLLWNAISEGAKNNLAIFDMGRSELSNTGLVTFKDRWGTTREGLSYSAYPTAVPAMNLVRAGNLGRRLCSWAPDIVLTTAGRLLYRHMA